MLPGPTIIRQCAACAQPFQQETLMSGNTFGATFWTDGKMDAPMLPERYAVIKCPHCQTLLWIDEQATLGEVEWHDQDTFPKRGVHVNAVNTTGCGPSMGMGGLP